MRQYHIEFKTKGFPHADGKKLLATTVSIGTEILPQSDRKFNVALAADPLYPLLEAYVLANPSGKNDR